MRTGEGSMVCPEEFSPAAMTLWPRSKPTGNARHATSIRANAPRAGQSGKYEEQEQLGGGCVGERRETRISNAAVASRR